MVEPGAIRPIDCACGKAFIWASEEGIEVQCHSCRRRVLVPFEHLRGRDISCVSSSGGGRRSDGSDVSRRRRLQDWTLIGATRTAMTVNTVIGV